MRLRAFVFASAALLATASFALAQPPAKTGKAKKQQPAASWVLPPVEAANLRYATFDSAVAGEKVSYLIYLPPGYDKTPGRRFPTVFWLHGIGGSQQGVPRICERFTAAIAAGKAPETIFVFVNGMVDSFYCDAAKAKRPVESVIIKDLIPHIDATYRTLGTRAGRMIEGFSMGGFGAAHLGFKYPELFGSISIIDGALLGLAEMKSRHPAHFERIFGGSDEAFVAESPIGLAEKNSDAVRGRTVIRMTVGALGPYNERYHAVLQARKIAHEYEVFSDAGHNQANLYDRLGDKNWEFYRRAFAQK